MKTLLNTLDHVLNQTVILGYDRVGYYVRKPLWNPEDTQVDLSGKICVVTGANSGLGFATAKALAARNAQVIMACRSMERGEKARQEIIAATDNTQITLEQVDLSLIHSVNACIERLQDKYDHIDILVNNAGALFNERQETKEGFEKTFATDLLGPYLLTRGLIPLLKRSDDGRIINVSSGGMYFGKLHLEDLQYRQRPYNGAMAYAEAKRGLMILTQLWAEALKETSIKVNAMHPGWADTPGVASSLPGFRQLTQWVLRDNEEGADTIIWLAAKPHLNDRGKFFFDRRPRALHRTPNTRSSLSDIESFWNHLGKLTAGTEPFPYALKSSYEQSTTAPEHTPV